MTISMFIFPVVIGVNSLAVDTQTGELFFSMGTRVRTVGNRVIVEGIYTMHGIAVDPVLR